MTREELVNSREYKIAGAALNDISNIDEEYADNEDYIGGCLDGFESGALWADEHPNEGLVNIDKVCEWLYQRQAVDLEVSDIEKFINDFKNEMESKYENK